MSTQPPDLLAPKDWSPSANQRTVHSGSRTLGCLSLTLSFITLNWNPSGSLGFRGHKPPVLAHPCNKSYQLKNKQQQNLLLSGSSPKSRLSKFGFNPPSSYVFYHSFPVITGRHLLAYQDLPVWQGKTDRQFRPIYVSMSHNRNSWRKGGLSWRLLVEIWVRWLKCAGTGWGGDTEVDSGRGDWLRSSASTSIVPHPPSQPHRVTAAAQWLTAPSWGQSDRTTLSFSLH